MSLVTIGLMSGDPSGVGPELCAKLISRKADAADLRIVVYGGRESLQDGFRIAGLPPPLMPAAGNIAELPPEAGVALIEGLDRPGFRPGHASAAGGAAVLAALEAVAADAAEDELDAIVYAPLNKQALWLAGHRPIDELHFFRDRLGITTFCCELNKQGALWTSRVTSHIPLREVADGITVNSIMAATALGAAAARASSGCPPRIAMAGLNPHLGEGGVMGREEIDVIVPAIKKLTEAGYDIAGLFPADTLFLKIEAERIDLVITMFHDQGQIALKALGFADTVTVLGGLPLPVMTPSQGTAYDIVGQNRADPTGLLGAFDLAERLARATRRTI